MADAALPAWQRVLTRSWERRGPLSWLLWPLSLLLGLLVRLRQGLYLSGLLTRERVRVPVIVVGNVVAGGAGKTPVAIALVRHLLAQGRHPGVISRGYGRSSEGCQEVLADSPACDTGDEPLLIKRRSMVPVFVASRRADAAQALLARHPQTDILVCDDGLQHLQLARDIEICVFDDRGTGNGRLLPAGPLREPWPRHVDLVLHTGFRPAFTGFTARRALGAQARRADGSHVELAQLGRTDTPLLAVAAIARPQSFFDMLATLGLPLARTIALPDHYDFAHWQLPTDADYILLCTEKDAVKLWHRFPKALAVSLELEPEPAFFAALDLRLANLPPPPLSSNHGHTTS